MVKSHRRSFPEKYRALFLSGVLLLFCFIGNGQTYSPGAHVVVNDAVSPAQATPLDARSQFYDAVNFRYRWFQSTNEVLSYLNTSTYRTGNFIIIVDSGGTLQSNGTYINGTATFYMFKDSTTNAGLIKLNLLGSSGCSGCLLAANNLSDLSNLTTALTNLGLNNVNNTSDAQKFAAVATLTNKNISGLSNTFSNIPVSALSQNSIGLSVTSNSAADIAVTTTPAQLGTSLVINFPTANSTNRGALSSANWSFFNGKLDSVHFSNDSLYNCVNGVCSFAGIASGGGGGSGTVQNLTVNPLSPLFTVSVATPTTTPIVTFTLSNAAAYTVFGDSTGSSAAPFYYKPNAALLNTWFGGTLQGALTLTTTGSSGAATLVGNTLNIPVYTTGSGGSTNSNIGSGYRWAVPTTNNIKTVFGSLIIWDSTTNTNALTATADTSSGNQKLATQGFVSRSYQPTGNYITGLNGDVSATGPGLVSATIQPLAVTTGKIAANAVTLTKMATNTANTLIGYDGSGNPTDVTTGNLSPLFTTALSSGVLTFTQINVTGYSVYGHFSSGTGTSTFSTVPIQALATGSPNQVIGLDGSGNPTYLSSGTNISIGGGTISTTANVSFTNLVASGTVNLTGIASGGSTDSIMTINASTGKVGWTSRLFTLYVYNYGASGLGTIFASGGDSIIGKKLIAGSGIGLIQNTDSSITVSATGVAGVSSVTDNGGGTLTISPSTGAVLAGINLSNSNTWLTTETFQNILPSANATYNLGSTSAYWNNLYSDNLFSSTALALGAASGSNINLKINGVTQASMLSTGQMLFNNIPGGNSNDLTLTDSAGYLRSAFVWPNEAPIDSIYAPKYFNSTDWTVNGSASLSSAGVLTGGSNGVYTNFITVGSPQNYQYWHYIQGFRITTPVASGGVEVGLHSANVSNKYDIGVNIPLGLTGVSNIILNSLGSNVVFATSTRNITFSSGDSVTADIRLSLDSVYVTVTDNTVGITDSAQLIKAWSAPTPSAAGQYYPNESYFAIFTLGGTQTIGLSNITSTWLKNVTGLLLTDSRGEYAGTNWTSGPMDSVNLMFPHSQTWCGEGSSSREWLLAENSILNLNPHVIITIDGSNGVRAGLSNAQIWYTEDSLMADFASRGYQCYLGIWPEDSTKSGVGMTVIKNRDSLKYAPLGKYIDVWNPLTHFNGSNVLYSAYEYTDGIHIIALGQSVAYHAILNSGVMTAMTSRQNFLQRSGLFTHLGAGQVDIDSIALLKWLKSENLAGTPTLSTVLTAGNSAANTITLTGFGATAPNLIAGGINLQDIQANEGTINYNNKFNGGGNVYTVSGYAERIFLYDGQWIFYSATNGSSGASVALNPIFKFDQNGAFVLGNTNLSSTLGTLTGGWFSGNASGVLTAPAYGAGTNTGTVAYYLAVTSAGKFIEASGTGSGVTSVGTFSGSSIANGASISGSTITFGPADGTNPGMITTGAQTLAGNKTLNANITANHFFSQGSTPSVSAGGGAGTSPTVSIVGNDQDGDVTVITGTLPSGGGTIVSITFTSSFPNHSYPILFPQNALTALLSGTSSVFTTGTTTGWLILSNSVGLTASTTYVWHYHIGGN